jgi:hypothetical protein
VRLSEKIVKSGEAHPIVVALLILLGFGVGTYLIALTYVYGLEWLYSLATWLHIPFIVILSSPIWLGIILVSLINLGLWLRKHLHRSI